jgi:hypothetical protein
VGIGNGSTDGSLWSDSRLGKGVVARVKVLAFLRRVDPSVSVMSRLFFLFFVR